MGIDLGNLITPGVSAAIKLFAVIAAVMELGFALILHRQVARVSQNVQIPGSGCITFLVTVHLLLLVGILLLVILY